MTPLTLLAGATTYIWPYLHTKTSLIILAIFYGYVLHHYFRFSFNVIID